MTAMSRRRGPLLALAGLAGAAGAWELARRRDVAALRADPSRDVLTAPLPGRPRVVTSHDGTRLRVQDAGPRDAGTTLVLVHGWGMGARFWVHHLRALSSQVRVLAYDQRGHVASEAPASGDYSVEALAGDLRAVVDALVDDGDRLVAAGHSLGGMSVMGTAALDDRPLKGRLDEALLFDTAGSGVAAGMFAGLGAIEEAAGALNAAAVRARVPAPRRTTPISSRAVRALACSPSAAPSAVALTEQLFFDCPVDARAAIGATLGALDLDAAVAGFDVPATVVVGSRDRLTPPVQSERLVAALPDARLHVVEGAGHQSPLERPAETIRLLQSRLEPAAS